MNTIRDFKVIVVVAVMFGAVAYVPEARAAARSTTVIFNNKSDTALIGSSGNLIHGCWDTKPPDRIEAGSSVTWKSESCGVATGTEGEVTYNIETGPGQTNGSAYFHWDNPYAGSNSYDESAPVGYTATHSGGDGNDATVTWDFDCSSATCDGIPDDWKRNGVTIDPGDGSGPQFIDLPAMGATVNTPDIFVQLDWMADLIDNHQLSPAAIQTVVTAFANSPFKSRTGSVGINLHVDEGPGSIMNFATNAPWGALSRAQQLTEITNLGTGDGGNYNWTAFENIKNALGGFKSTGRLAIFHYVISAHQIGDGKDLGISRGIPGSDFIVGLGAAQPGVFMHELGHNLGLRHGGGDDVNNKPNYLSLMNYSFVKSGLTINGVPNFYDYSRAALNALDETNLDETTGVGAGASGFATSHWCPKTGTNPGAFVTVPDGSQAIDWDCDGGPTDNNLLFDVNNDGATSPPLAPYDDWANLKLMGGAIGAGAAAEQPTETPIDGLTPEAIALVLPVDTTPPVTMAGISPPPNPAGWNGTDVTVTPIATDDISGVARTDAGLDGAGFSPVGGPITISTDGIHTLNFRSIDRAQNVELTKQVTIRIDTTPPVVSGMPANCILWPPNHKMVQVATISASAGISGLASFNVTGTSNEPPSPGNTDIVITGTGLQPRVVTLRAERSGTGNGRIYTLTATASSVAGLSTTTTATCTVPHDQGQ